MRSQQSLAFVFALGSTVSHRSSRILHRKGSRSLCEGTFSMRAHARTHSRASSTTSPSSGGRKDNAPAFAQASAGRVLMLAEPPTNPCGLLLLSQAGLARPLKGHVRVSPPSSRPDVVHVSCTCCGDPCSRLFARIRPLIRMCCPRMMIATTDRITRG